jgi:ring-1,2-phenylacetyl-CoA epoxidase subunit PaaE
VNDNASGTNPDFIPLFIENIVEETKDFKVFTFRDGHGITYEPGQFITLIDQSGLQEVRRSYSILSTPVLQEPLSIAVKRIDNGFFSRNLVDRARTGDRLLTTGAAGFFRLPANIKSFDRIFFFAAGSGIAPILPLLKTVLYRYPDMDIFLIYSNQSLETTAFHDPLSALGTRFPDRLHIDFMYSSRSDLRKARLNRELLTEFLTIDGVNREKTIFYTCGPENYMRMIHFHLLEEGFPRDHIKKEDFNPGNKKTRQLMPPDKNSYRVDLEFKGSIYRFPVSYPDSILKAAQKQKLALPYSCETGRCGSCAAMCISGKVWLSNNEVLTDKDLAEGLTLTCTGHPQYGDVALKIG